MEKDRKLEKIMKEHGISSAPVGFTGNVMKLIGAAEVKKSYKPLISPVVWILLGIFFILLLVMAFSGLFDNAGETLFHLPEISFELPKIPPLFTAGIAAGIIAIFFLALTDFSISSRRR